jgi:hypothetical protein
MLILFMRPARIELATFGFVVQHSIQLSYGRIILSKSTVFYYHIHAPLVNETYSEIKKWLVAIFLFCAITVNRGTKRR